MFVFFFMEWRSDHSWQRAPVGTRGQENFFFSPVCPGKFFLLPAGLVREKFCWPIRPGYFSARPAPGRTRCPSANYGSDTRTLRSAPVLGEGGMTLLQSKNIYSIITEIVSYEFHFVFELGCMQFQKHIEIPKQG